MLAQVDIENNLPIVKGNFKLTKVAIKVDPQNIKSIHQKTGTPSGDNITPYWGIPKHYAVITSQGKACGSLVIADDYFEGPATATDTVSKAVSVRLSVTGGITAKEVSASIGFDVPKSYQVTKTISVPVPAGHTVEIIAHPIYNVASFDVYYNPPIGSAYKTGSGVTYEPVGVCFSQYMRTNP